MSKPNEKTEQFRKMLKDGYWEERKMAVRFAEENAVPLDLDLVENLCGNKAGTAQIFENLHSFDSGYLWNNYLEQTRGTGGFEKQEGIRLFYFDKGLSEHFRLFSHFKWIDFNNLMLEEIGPEVALLENVEDLDFSDNYINYISDEIGELGNLKFLNLGGNQIQKIPDGIGDLTNLEKLNLTFNKIEDLPGTFSNLEKLRFLVLRANKFYKIPEAIKNLKNLEILDFSFNEDVFNLELLDSLPNLKYVDLDFKTIEKIFNKGKKLPDVVKLKCVEEYAPGELNLTHQDIDNFPTLDCLSYAFLGINHLDLRNNKISELPEKFADFLLEVTVDLRNNPIHEVDKELYNSCISERLKIDWSHVSLICKKGFAGFWISEGIEQEKLLNFLIENDLELEDFES